MCVPEMKQGLPSESLQEQQNLFALPRHGSDIMAGYAPASHQHGWGFVVGSQQIRALQSFGLSREGGSQSPRDSSCAVTVWLKSARSSSSAPSLRTSLRQIAAAASAANDDDRTAHAQRIAVVQQRPRSDRRVQFKAQCYCAQMRSQEGRAYDGGRPWLPRSCLDRIVAFQMIGKRSAGSVGI